HASGSQTAWDIASSVTGLIGLKVGGLSAFTKEGSALVKSAQRTAGAARSAATQVARKSNDVFRASKGALQNGVTKGQAAVWGALQDTTSRAAGFADDKLLLTKVTDHLVSATGATVDTIDNLVSFGWIHG